VVNKLGRTTPTGSSTIGNDTGNAIVGGKENWITATNAECFIGGGRHNIVTNGVSWATVPGGRNNTAGGDYAFAAGRRAKANHDGTFVWADSTDADFRSSGINQFLIRANGGVGINVTNPVDALHVQSDSNLRVRTTSTGTGFAGFLSENSLGEWFAGVAATTNHWYVFENAPASGARLVIKSGGNVGIGTTNPTNKLHVIGGVSATAFVTTSDRNAKENFSPVDAKGVLEKVAALPITQWNFKGDQATRHIGPMAQDFYAAFKTGPGETSIATVDADGVALAAIQGLNQKVEDLNRELKQRDAENAELKLQISDIKRILANLSTKEVADSK